MYYKFSKRRQKVWLRNVNKSLRTAHDTGDVKDYSKHHYYIDSCMIRHPKVFRRLDYKFETRLARTGWLHLEERYYLKAKKHK